MVAIKNYLKWDLYKFFLITDIGLSLTRINFTLKTNHNPYKHQVWQVISQK